MSIPRTTRASVPKSSGVEGCARPRASLCELVTCVDPRVRSPLTLVQSDARSFSACDACRVSASGDGDDEGLRRADEVRGAQFALSALTAACAAGMFALTQVPAMGDWGTKVATYAFAFGLPVAAAGAWEATGESASKRVASAISASLFLSAAAVFFGVSGLFTHFHEPAGLFFAGVAFATLLIWMRID